MKSDVTSDVICLDPKNDKYARVALRAYAAACRNNNPKLADAIEKLLGELDELKH